ncbi:MAG: flagellar biosynthesis anti-sigma factor FlgM, partial [Desulfocucumaceae bacterium]
MKVNGYGNNLEVLKAYNSQKKPQIPKEKEQAAGAGEDTLELSVQAREMQEIQAGLRETKDVRDEKVDRIKKE